MRVLIQRVSDASVSVDDQVVGAIGTGLLLFVGIAPDDGDVEVRQVTNKIANLRIFEDDDGQMNRSAIDIIAGHPAEIGMLVVSQFTLYGDIAKGRRPSFIKAATPEHASRTIRQVAIQLQSLGFRVAEGIFGADMAVRLTNDGPVTIWLDSDDLRPAGRPRQV